MPVRIELDKKTRSLRVGSQANVIVYSSDNAIMNAIGYVRMRVIALLSYVSSAPGTLSRSVAMPFAKEDSGLSRPASAGRLRQARHHSPDHRETPIWVGHGVT